MTRTLALLALSLLAGGCKRTELLIGVVTDIEAPDSVDTVRLTVTRDGKEVFPHRDWSISGVPDKPFELPGSFGVYSPDGSTPLVNIRVAGLKNGVEVLHRDSTVSLLGQRTLFMRMGLVKRCIPTDCGPTMTCVEGRCQSPTIDPATLPEYVKDLEKSVTCSSGTVFVNTGTRQPLPVMGMGDCAADEQCGEGTCYKLPAQAMTRVTGSKVDTFVTEAGETAVPVDLSTKSIAAMVPDGHGGFTSIAGTGASDGTFVIDAVPPGRYVLRVNQIFLDTEARVIDLGEPHLRRFDAVPATTQVQYVYNLTGLSPWQAQDILELYAPNDQQFGYDQDPGMMPILPLGSTSVNGFNATIFGGGGNNQSDLVDPAEDPLRLVQITSRTMGPLLIQPLVKIFQPTGVRNVDGMPTTLTGTMTDVPLTQTFSGMLRGSLFDAAARQGNPNATLQALASMDVNTRPGPLAYGFDGATLDLLFVTFPNQTVPSDQSFSANYGTPFPSNWGTFVISSQTMQMAYALAGSQPTNLITRVESDVELATAQMQPIVPLVTPPLGPTVDDRSLYEDQTLSNPTPTLRWTAPTTGTPTQYTLEVFELSVSNGKTRQSAGATLQTAVTEVHLAPGMIDPGHIYVFRLSATVASQVSAARQPLRTSIPFGSASVLSGILTVGGNAAPPDGGIDAADLGAGKQIPDMAFGTVD